MGMVKKACGILGSSGSSMAKRMSKLKTLLHLTVCRIAVLKSQHNARCSHARDDLLQLIQLGHLDRALLRVQAELVMKEENMFDVLTHTAELVIKEENMLDVFAMLEGYCHLLTERSVLLRGQKVCPGELREAASSLVYASSRLGDLPELYHVRTVFSSMFGKDFTNSAVEIRNSCGVNPKIVHSLSTRQPSLETRVRITKEIAAAKGITLDLVCNEPTTGPNNNDKITKPTMQADTSSTPNKTGFPAIVTHKYKDAVSAAQAALESAEDAAAAAKAAVELSRPSQPSSDDHGSRRGQVTDSSVDDKTLDSDEEDAVEYSCNPQIYPNEDKEVKKSESSNSSDTSEGEDDIEIYFSSARLFPDDKNMRRTPYTFRSNLTESPMNEEEDTFELASLKNSGKDYRIDEMSEIEIEKPSFRGWVFDAASDSGLSDQHAASNLNNHLCQKNIIPGRKNREFNLESKNTDSSETKSFQTEIGHEESTNILSKITRNAVSVRAQRGLRR